MPTVQIPCRHKLTILAESMDHARYLNPEYKDEVHIELEKVREKGCNYAYCNCMGNGPGRQLAIIKREGSRNFLQIMKNDKENHHPLCGFRLRIEGIIHFSDVPNFKENGKKIELYSDLKLQFDLEEKESVKSDILFEEGKPVNKWQIRARKRTGLGGLMNYLVVKSELNCWTHGEIRNYLDFAVKLHHSADNVVIKGINLKDRLLVCGNLDESVTQQELFHSALDKFLLILRKESIENRTQARGLILDEILEVQKIDGNTILRCRYLGDQILLKNKFADDLKKSTPSEWAGIGKKNAHVLGLFMVCENDVGDMQVVDANLFLTSDDYIVVESYPEVEMANRLVIEERSFMKPYRAWNESRFIADFILLDMLDEWAVEVWGMETEEYKNEKEIKEKYYKESLVNLVGWVVASQLLVNVALPQKEKKLIYSKN
jgi:hypothetical protein